MNRRIVQCRSVCPICGQSAYVERNYIRYCNHCDIYIDGLDMPVTNIAEKQPDRQEIKLEDKNVPN